MTECPIRSVIFRVTKSDDHEAGVHFVNHQYDYRPTSDETKSHYQLIITVTISEENSVKDVIRAFELSFDWLSQLFDDKCPAHSNARSMIKRGKGSLIAGVPVRFRKESFGSRTGGEEKLRRGRRRGRGEGGIPLPLRSFFPRPSPTPERILPETNGNACNAGYLWPKKRSENCICSYVLLIIPQMSRSPRMRPTNSFLRN